jgi:cytoskeletal protein RodZ
MFAIPVAIVVLCIASLSAQVGVVWPNYEAELKKAEQAAPEEKSKKPKSEHGPASKNKTRKADESSSEADGGSAAGAGRRSRLRAQPRLRSP